MTETKPLATQMPPWMPPLPPKTPPRKLAEMPATSTEDFTALTASMPEEPSNQAWTLWNEAHSMCSALRKVSDYCLDTADQIEGRLRKLSQMLGKQP